MLEKMFGSLVGANPESIGHHGPHQARLNAIEEAPQPTFPHDLPPTAQKPSIGYESVPGVPAKLVDLYFSFDDVLGVGEQPAADACHRAYEAPLHEGQGLVWGVGQHVLQDLVGGKLGCIGRDLPRHSGKCASEQPPHALLLDGRLQTLTTVFELVRIQLHPTLDELHGPDHESVGQSCKCPILDPIKQTQIGLAGYLLIELVAAENNCIDDGHGDKWIVHAIVEFEYGAVGYHLPEVAQHGRVGVHLQLDLESVEYVAGQAVGHSRDAAAQEVVVPLQLGYC